MPAGTYNFVNLRGQPKRAIEQGARLYRKFVWTDANGDPIPLTDHTGRMQIRLTIDATSTLADWDTDDYLTINGVEGEVVLDVPDSVTEDLDWAGRAVYDIELIDASDHVTRFLEGEVELSREVTRVDA